MALSVVGSAMGEPTPDPVKTLLDSARMWDAKDRADLARLALEKALLTEPDNPDALFELGMLEIRSAQFKRAAELLDQLRRTHPQHPATRSLADAYRIATTDRLPMATARFLSSAVATKADAVKAARALFPKGPPKGDLGIEYYQILAGYDPTRAEAKAGLERLIRDAPDDPRPKLGLADFYNDKPETRKKGIAMAARLAQRDDLKPIEVQKVWRRGLHKLDLDPDDEPLYRQFLAVFPDDGEIQQKLKEVSDPLRKARHAALKELAAGRVQSAEVKLLALLKKYPNDVESLEAMGKVRLSQDRVNEASRYFAAAAKRDPSRAGKFDSQLRTARFWAALRAAKTALDQGRLDAALKAAHAAVRLRPGEVEAQLTLAAVQLGRGDHAAAQAGYRRILQHQPENPRAIGGLLAVYRATADRRGALRFLDDLASRRPKLAASFASERAGLLRDEGDMLIDQGKPREAQDLLERAVAAVPVDPWLRYDLARLYQRLGFPERGREVWAARPNPPDDPQANYAEALYLTGIDDETGALNAIERTPSPLRSELMERLAEDSRFRQQLKEVRHAVAQRNPREAQRLLAKIERDNADQPDRLWTIAGLWVEIGRPERGVQLAKRLQHEAQPPDRPDPRLRYADLLDDAQFDAELGPLLAALPADIAHSEADAELLRRIRRGYTIRQAEALAESGATSEARASLTSAREHDPDDPRLFRALAELEIATGRLDAADAAYRSLLARNPADFDARLSLIKIARLRGDTEVASNELAQLRASAPPDDADAHLGIARQLTGLDDYDAAREEISLVRKLRPNDPKVLLQAGRIEKYSAHYEEALDLFRASAANEFDLSPPMAPLSSLASGTKWSPAAVEIQSIQSRRQGYFTAGFDYRELSGTPGISGVTNQEYPMLFRYPIGYIGHVFTQVDYATVSAGSLNLVDWDRINQYGKIDALGTPPYTGKLDQSAAGAAFALGFQNGDWRFDVGSSPQGYPVSYPVGGIRHNGRWGDVYYSWDLARRPMANSLLSYAGARDPVTDEVWGGVHADGGDIYMGYDYGRFGVFAQAGAHYFSGENVRANNDLTFRAGADWGFILEPEMRLTAGFALMYWTYAHNERFYTFGYGGYFSPQDYKSIALPVQWTGRWGDLSYLLRAYCAYSVSKEDGGVFYPTDRNLQALAEQRAGQVINGVEFPRPYHDASLGDAVSYGIRGTFEYQFDENWFVGGLLELQRSPFYTPNFMTFYFRYAFEPRSEPIPFPPQPLRPYYRY